MKNKVLIKLIVPELDTTFDVFVPVNEIMWKIMNKNTGMCYDNNVILYDTDIRNATEVLFLQRK